MAAKPFVRGKNTIFRFFLDGKTLDVDIKDWEITKNVTTHNDPVNGEQSDRLDASFTHYSGTCNIYTKDANALDALLDDQANEDASAIPLIKAASMKMMPRDGSSQSYVCGDMIFDGTSLKSGSRTDAVMLTLPYRFRTLKKVPSL